MEAHRLAGDIDYILKVRVANARAYDAFYRALIKEVSIFNVTSALSMEEIKSTTALPIRRPPRRADGAPRRRAKRRPRADLTGAPRACGSSRSPRTTASRRRSPRPTSPRSPRWGIRSIMCNRPDGEDPGQPAVAEIRAEAERLGLAFAFVPVISGQITDEDVADFAAALDGLPAPVLAYCRSGSRCQNLWMLSRQHGQAAPAR